RQGPQRHRPVDLVVEGSDLGIRSDRPEEDDDGPRVVPAHAVHDRLDIDPGSLDLNHRAPPLTGGKRATSSPSRKTLPDRTTSAVTRSRYASRASVSFRRAASDRADPRYRNAWTRRPPRSS